MFQPASSAELIRSIQKDTFFIQNIRTRLLDICSELYGPRSHKYESFIDLSSKFCYFTCTTLCNGQTLGEEFCSIIPIIAPILPFNLFSRGKNSPSLFLSLRKPGLFRKFALLSFSILLPFYFNNLRKHGRHVPIDQSMSS